MEVALGAARWWLVQWRQDPHARAQSTVSRVSALMAFVARAIVPVRVKPAICLEAQVCAVQWQRATNQLPRRAVLRVKLQHVASMERVMEKVLVPSILTEACAKKAPAMSAEQRDARCAKRVNAKQPRS